MNGSRTKIHGRSTTERVSLVSRIDGAIARWGIERGIDLESLPSAALADRRDRPGRGEVVVLRWNTTDACDPRLVQQLGAWLLEHVPEAGTLVAAPPLIPLRLAPPQA